MKCNRSRPGFEFESPCPFPTTITITPQAHLTLSKSQYISIYGEKLKNKLTQSDEFIVKEIRCNNVSVLINSHFRLWPWRPGFNSRSNHTEVSKMALDASLLNTINYKVKWKRSLRVTLDNFAPRWLWPGVVAPDRILSLGQIEQTICVNSWLMLNCDCYIAILQTI